MGATIYLSANAKEQLDNRDCNKWCWAVPYTETKNHKEYPYGVELINEELCAIDGRKFHPELVPDLEALVKKIFSVVNQKQ